MKTYDDSGGKDCNSDVWHDPVNVVLGRPPVDENPDWDEEAPGNHEWNTQFWSANAIVLVFEASVNTIVEGCSDLSSKEEPEA